VSRLALIITVVVLIGYYIFTSGLVYELTGNNNTASLEIPYSFGMSAERVGLAAVLNDDDINCLKWLSANWKEGDLVVSDYNISRIIDEYDYRIYLKYQGGYGKPTFWNNGIPDRCYIFVSSWNVHHKKYVLGTNIGLRSLEDLPDLPYDIAYRSGDAIVYRRGFD
jgi:uncharacterized membrane protein